MGYINKELVLSGLNLRLLRLKCEHENADKINELENVIGAISETETEDVIERSKVDKAIEEFKTRYPKNVYGELELGGIACEFSLKEVLEIIKRNIGE